MGAANGRVVLADGVVRDFCDLFEFSNAKATQVSAITSYRIGPADAD